MSFIKKIINKFKNSPFDIQITLQMFLFNIIANFIIIASCSSIIKNSINYSILQINWIVCTISLSTIIIEILFHYIVTKPLYNKILYWESTNMIAKEMYEILELAGSFPEKKANELFCIFLINNIVLSFCTHHLLNFNTQISFFYFHMYLTFSYIFILISISIIEKKCSKYAIKIAAQIKELKTKKYFGLSQKTNFILFFVIPIIGAALLTIHATYLSIKLEIIESITRKINSKNIDFLIEQNLFKSNAIFFILKITVLNTICIIIMTFFYYARIFNNTKHMLNSLVMLTNKNINQTNLFEINIFSEDSYSLYLINKTILLFDSIIKNNTLTNKEINNISKKLSEISLETTENVNKQSANIEEILATMQSVDNLSKKIETNFNEVIKVASKTMKNVDLIHYDLDDNFNIIKEISSSNKNTIESLRMLSNKISRIRDEIKYIDKLLKQTITIAFNAELEANSITTQEVDFSNLAEEIRLFSNSSLEVTKTIHNQITKIYNNCETIIEKENNCMDITNEENELCIRLKENFENIKQTAKSTSINSSNIKETIHNQTNSFHQIVNTLSKITKNLHNFGISSIMISEIIENLKQSSTTILEINNSYSKDEK